MSQGIKGIKKPKMINIVSTGISRFSRFSNKPKQKYGLFDEFSLAVIGACEVAKNPHIFLFWAKQHIQEISRHFYWILNNVGPMVFAENKEQN